MKVAFLIRSLDLGGSQRQTAVLAAGLARRGHDVSVLTYYPGGEFEETVQTAGVRVSALSNRPGWTAPVRLGLRLLADLRRNRPDGLVAVLPSSTVLAGALRWAMPRETRLIWSIRAADMPLERYGWRARQVYRLQRRWLRLPDRIIVNSERASRFLREQPGPPPRASILVCPNAVDTGKFRPEDTSVDDGSSVADGGPIGNDGSARIGFVGRLDPVKDPDLFMLTLQRLIDAGRRIRAVMIVPGDARARAILAGKARALGIEGQVELEACASDMAGYYRSLDTLLITSVSESLPNVALEALACGVPVVSTDVGDVESVIGPYGRVVASRTPEALADAVASVLADDAFRRRVRLEAPHSIDSRYGLNKILSDFEALIE